MKETLFVSFNLGKADLSLTRSLLAHAGLTGTADLCNEDHPLAGLCSMTVPAGDERVQALRTRLNAMGREPSVRMDRHYTQAELSRADWLQLGVATAGLSGDVNLGQDFDHSDACASCGVGSVPVGPLLADLPRMGQKLLDRTAHNGNLVASKALTEAIVRSGLTGIEIRPVRSRRLPTDSGYHWLHISRTWPPMTIKSVLKADDLCPTCHRTGFFHPGDRPMEWHYSQPPSDAADFNCTWERFGYWRGNGFSGRGVGGQGGIIVSQRVRDLFERLRVKRAQYVPVIFDA